jgi:hypothetical protein
MTRSILALAATALVSFADAAYWSPCPDFTSTTPPPAPDGGGNRERQPFGIEDLRGHPRVADLLKRTIVQGASDESETQSHRARHTTPADYAKRSERQERPWVAHEHCLRFYFFFLFFFFPVLIFFFKKSIHSNSQR